MSTNEIPIPELLWFLVPKSISKGKVDYSAEALGGVFHDEEIGDIFVGVFAFTDAGLALTKIEQLNFIGIEYKTIVYSNDNDMLRFLKLLRSQGNYLLGIDSGSN